MATKDEKQARTAARAGRLHRLIDPAAAQHVTSLPDAVGPAVGLRQAERENTSLRLLEQLLEQQQETNRLLTALLERG